MFAVEFCRDVSFSLVENRRSQIANFSAGGQRSGPDRDTAIFHISDVKTLRLLDQLLDFIMEALDYLHLVFLYVFTQLYRVPHAIRAVNRPEGGRMTWVGQHDNVQLVGPLLRTSVRVALREDYLYCIAGKTYGSVRQAA